MPSSTTAPEVSVSTVAATETLTGHHLLKIEGYKHLKGMHPNGSYFDSCRFNAAGHAWKLRCYPNGSSSKAAGYFSLYLLRDDDDDNEAAAAVVYAVVRFALVYPWLRSRLLPWPRREKTGTATISHGFGFPEFARVTWLERSGFLKSDCLAVRCDITAVEKTAVKDEIVKAADMARLGMLCKCKDDLCKRHHRA